MAESNRHLSQTALYPCQPLLLQAILNKGGAVQLQAI